MIFVTGATGLVGSFLIRKLLDKGHSIKALKREGSDLNLVSEVYDQVNWVDGDLLDAVLLDRELKDVESVFHCAALVSFDGKNKELLNDTNVTGTEHVIPTTDYDIPNDATFKSMTDSIIVICNARYYYQVEFQADLLRDTFFIDKPNNKIIFKDSLRGVPVQVIIRDYFIESTTN